MCVWLNINECEPTAMNAQRKWLTCTERSSRPPGLPSTPPPGIGGEVLRSRPVPPRPRPGRPPAARVAFGLFVGVIKRWRTRTRGVFSSSVCKLGVYFRKPEWEFELRHHNARRIFHFKWKKDANPLLKLMKIVAEVNFNIWPSIGLAACTGQPAFGPRK